MSYTHWGEIVDSTRKINDIPFYINAFSTEINLIWQDTPFVSNVKLDELCFYRALTCMLRESMQGEEMRRKLLYYYLAPVFNTVSINSTLNRLAPILPSDNSAIKKIIKNTANLYTETPARTIKGNNEQRLIEILRETNYNNFMLNVHKALELTNEILVRPLINLRNGKKTIRWQYYYPDKYCYTMDEYDNILELWLNYTALKDDGESEVKFKVWTKDQYRIADYKGEFISFQHDGRKYGKDGMPNPYERIPYNLLKLYSNKDEFKETQDGSRWELVRGQLDCNKIEFEMFQLLDYTGFPLKITTNMPVVKSGMDLSPGGLISLIEVRDAETSGLVEPNMEVISADLTFQSVHELKKEKMREILKNNAMPASLIEDNPGTQPSGIAMQIERIELAEYRKYEIPLMKPLDDENIRLLIDILNRDPASDLKIFGTSDTYEFTLDYAEPQTIADFALQIQQYDTLKERGLISPKDYVVTLTGNETIKNDEEALKLINDNKQLWSKTNDTANTGTASPVQFGDSQQYEPQ